MMRLVTLIGLTGVLAATGAAAESTAVIIERGRAVFATCAACHREASAEVPNPGPDLRGVFGRAAGTVPGFRYSRAMRKANRTWSEDTLDVFLQDPQATLPGNAMPFPGLPEETKRRDLIAFLKSYQ